MDPNDEDMLIDVKRHLKATPLDRYWLINEAFILWYTLVEGIEVESFSEPDRQRMLLRNFHLFQGYFNEDTDYNFIIGWMANISPWYFAEVNDDFGNDLMLKAYKKSSKNSLFRWAVRGHVRINNNEIEGLQIDIRSRFKFYFDYGEFIEDYFERMINTRTAL